MVINDNPYSFILNEHPLSILAAEGAKEVALELNSLSKSHNMAGWRVGMLSGKAEFLADILRFKSNMDSGMFLAVQMAAIEALKNDADWYKSLNVIYAARQEKVFELLHHLGCSFSPDQKGMFVFAKIPPQYSSGYALSDRVLYDSNVFITPGGIFGSAADNYVRVSLCAQVPVFEEAINRVKQL